MRIINFVKYSNGRKLTAFPMTWDDSGIFNQLNLGVDQTDRVNMVVNSTVKSVSPLTDYTLYDSSLIIPKRTVASSAILSAFTVTSNSQLLSDNDSFTGYTVDLTDLEVAGSVVAEGSSVSSQGDKFAAVFKGGPVGINTEPTGLVLRPEATLHIEGMTDFNYALFVSGNVEGASIPSLVVSSNAKCRYW